MYSVQVQIPYTISLTAGNVRLHCDGVYPGEVSQLTSQSGGVKPGCRSWSILTGLENITHSYWLHHRLIQTNFQYK